HGVGRARPEYLPAHLGPELMAASRELKAIFDPRNLMNPGKIVPLECVDIGDALAFGERCPPAKAASEPPHSTDAPDARSAFRIDTNLRQSDERRIELPVAPVLGFVERD